MPWHRSGKSSSLSPQAIRSEDSQECRGLELVPTVGGEMETEVSPGARKARDSKSETLKWSLRPHESKHIWYQLWAAPWVLPALASRLQCVLMNWASRWLSWQELGSTWEEDAAGVTKGGGAGSASPPIAPASANRWDVGTRRWNSTRPLRESLGGRTQQIPQDHWEIFWRKFISSHLASEVPCLHNLRLKSKLDLIFFFITGWWKLGLYQHLLELLLLASVVKTASDHPFLGPLFFLGIQKLYFQPLYLSEAICLDQHNGMWAEVHLTCNFDVEAVKSRVPTPGFLCLCCADIKDHMLRGNGSITRRG